MRRRYFGDRRGAVAVRTVDWLPSSHIIGNEIVTASLTFEKNVGHLLNSVKRVYDPVASRESRKSSPVQPRHPAVPNALIW
jgi:hypothetical protein